MKKGQSPVKIACLQMQILKHDKDANLKKARQMIDEACAEGADLLILPETFNTGWIFADREEAFAHSEAVPEGRSCQMLLEAAKEKGVYIVATLVENAGVDLYNTAVLVGPEGFIGKYRKLHPCEDEVYWAEPGDLGLPVFHTKIGRIAVLICLDAYYPETSRICAMQGADVICVPSNWGDVKESRQLPDPYWTMGPVLCMANALSNHVIVAGCNCVGQIDNAKFPGQSVIASPWGAPLAGMIPNRECIVTAEVDLCDSRRKYFHPTNSRLANRRTDVYSADLGYDPKKYRQN